MWHYVTPALLLSASCLASTFVPETRTEKGWFFVDGNWSFTPKGLEQGLRCARAIFAFRHNEMLTDTAFSARFEVTQRGKGGVGAAGFIFRSVDSNHYYYVHFDTRNRQAVLVAADEKNVWVEIARKRELPFDMGEWHEGRVEAHGPKLSVFLDGKLVLSAQDDRYAAGAVGFRIGQARIMIEDIKVEGTPAPQTKPWCYSPRDRRTTWPDRETEAHQKVICEDAGVGAYEAFPDVCKLSNGDLYCVFYAGYSHASRPCQYLPKGGRICSVRSRDGGLNWSAPKLVIDLDEDDRDPSIIQLADGTLLCNFFQIGGGRGCLIVRSTDSGETWASPPTVVEPPTGMNRIYCSARILVLPDGTLLLPVYGRVSGVKNYVSAVVRSTDNGKTWGDATIIEDDHSHRYGHCEPALAFVPPSTLICHLRPCLCQTESADLGRTWTTPHDLGFRADAPDLLRTSNGILVTAYRIPGTSLRYSLDRGKTWSDNVVIDRVGGAYPSMVELSDGTILCVYYEEGGGSSIRATRFRVSRDGVEFVPWPEK